MDPYKAAKIKLENDKVSKEKYEHDSRERLNKIGKKKIQTTMVGALSVIEKHFGFLWGQDKQGSLTDEEKCMRELFELVRAEIFDNGNSQMRNFTTELTQYNIEWLRYHIDLPVKPELVSRKDFVEERNDEREGN